MEKNSWVSTYINYHGEYGPLMLFLNNIYLFRNKYFSLFYFVIGYIINTFINFGLKGILTQPRPGISEKELKLLLENKERFIIKNGFPYDIYGMPSGHTQSCFYSLMFMFLTVKNNSQLFIYLLISLCTIYQRVVFDHHTLFQVIIGGFVGIFMGYIIFYLSKESIKGKLSAKNDDWAIN